MRRPLICANWKMNHTLDSSIEFIKRFAMLLKPVDADAVIFPPFPFIYILHEYAESSGVYIGAQNINENEKGAHTGEVSAEMLKSIGVSWVLVGHSERRNTYGESDELVSKKLKTVIDSKMIAILCVGENIETREEGKAVEFVKNQLERNLESVSPDDMKLVVIAYEPIWAIGTGRAATPQDAEEIMSFIRKWLNEKYDNAIAETTRILYGGSVTPENMASFAAMPDIDGALVGGASLDPESFALIIHGAASAKNG